MTFETHIEIDCPIASVWRDFTNASLLTRWQATLQGVERVSGPPDAVGTVSLLTYREAGRTVAIRETIVARCEPTTIVYNLDSSLMTSTMSNAFAELGDARTRWTVTCDIRFRGLWRLMAVFGRSMLVRKTEDDMRRFKHLVESANRIEARV